MTDMVLANLANRYGTMARERQRARAVPEVAMLLRAIGQCDSRISALSTNIAEAERARDAVGMSRSRQKSHRTRPGGQRDRRQAGVHYNLYALRQERFAAVEQRSDLDARLRAHTQAVDDAFYALRHDLLEAVYARECANVSGFVARKQRLLAAANVDIRRADEFRVDAHRDALPTVNLFHGGLDVPDGPGHGHMTLISQEDANYVVTFVRPPDPLLLRFP